jgi:hypothetical protein
MDSILRMFILSERRDGGPLFPDVKDWRLSYNTNGIEAEARWKGWVRAEMIVTPREFTQHMPSVESYPDDLTFGTWGASPEHTLTMRKNNGLFTFKLLSWIIKKQPKTKNTPARKVKKEHYTYGYCFSSTPVVPGN